MAIFLGMIVSQQICGRTEY